MKYPKCFFPGDYSSGTYDIDYSVLYEKGYRGIIFDIDNTLVAHDAPADKKAVELFSRLRSLGFQTCLLSNNDEPRIRPFADAVESMFVPKGSKPLKKGFLAAMAKMGTNEKTTVLIGDQLFTDIWGANNAGIHSILVSPIAKDTKPHILLKRSLERIILKGHTPKEYRLP